jgi:hypothetical protein
MKRELTVIIERDEDGYFVGTVPELLFEKKGLMPALLQLFRYQSSQLLTNKEGSIIRES